MQGEFRKIGAANMPMYYTMSGTRTLALRMEIRLKTTVNKEILQSALDQTLCRYPNWQQTLISDGHNLFYRQNDRRPLILEDDGRPCRFVTEDTQGFLFRILYVGDTITVDMHHGLTDGKGNNEFFKTLLFYYFSGLGYDVAAEGRVRLIGDSPDATETEYTFEKYGNSETVPSFILKNAPAFRIPEEGFDPDEAKCRRFSITCPLDQMLAYSRENGTSVAPALTDMIARAVEKTYETGKEDIIGLLTANLRPYYHSESLENFSISFPIPYSHSLDSKPFSERAGELKAIMRKQLQVENFDVRIAKLVQSAEYMVKMEGTVEDKTRRLGAQMSLKKSACTFCLTYAGKIDLPDSFLPYISGIKSYMPSFIAPFTISGTTLGNLMTLMVMQDFDSGRLAACLTDEIRKTGIDAKLCDEGLFFGSSLIYTDIPIEERP